MKRFATHAMVLALMLMFSACASQYVSGDDASDYLGAQSDSDTLGTEVEREEYERPDNYHGSLGGSGNGCLELSVPDGDNAYYVKLKQGNDDVWDAFIHPGGKFRFGVPTGTFDLVYAAGDSWYGWEDTFGPQGAYSQSDESFTFRAGDCWAVELIMQPGGNLGRDALSYEEF